MIVRWLVALLFTTTTVSSSAIYERLLGKSQFHNKSEIEDFILNLQELNQLQSNLLGLPEVASDTPAQTFLDTVANMQPVKPDLLPYLFEGDIILSSEQMKNMISEKRAELEAKQGDVKASRAKRSLTSDTTIRWKFPIAYWIDTSTGVSSSAIAAGVAKWTELTCATFQQYRSQPSGVPSLRFIRGDGCYSYIGRTSYYSTQEVSIGTGCTSLGTVTHEIGHALGFYHEQSRPERDNYVSIQTQNIGSSYQSQFTKQSPSSAINYGVEYDYGSVMHYDAYGFSAYGGRTIITRDTNYQATIGQRDEPSFADVKQINFAYCNSTCAGSTLACQNGGYPDPKNCAVCRCPPGTGGTLCDQVQSSLSTSCGIPDLTATANLQTVRVSGDIDCYYRITAPAGRKVYVSFNTITFPAYTPCAVSYAEIKYRDNPVITGARVCGSNRPSSATSEGQTMYIIYKGASTSTFTFSYRFDPVTPVDTTTGAPTTTTTGSPGKPTKTTTTTTTQATTTTTRKTTTTTQKTTTPGWWWTSTAPSGACQWSSCTSDCGGCGTHTRQCNGRIETEYCNMNPCNGNACCRPFDVIIGGVCSRFDEEYNSNGTKPIVTNTLPEDEPSTTPYITPESEKHIIHIQPPKLPLTIELPEEVFRPPERTLEVVLPEELDHEGSGQSAPETEITQPSHTNTVEGSGQEPAPRRAVPVPVVSESSSPVVEKPKNIQEIDKTMQSAVATEAEERQIVGGYKDTSKPSCEEKDGDKNDLKDDKCPLSQVHKADDVKDSGDKKSSKNHGKSSESDEDLAAEREDRIRARRYIFPSAIPRIRLPTASITASGRGACQWSSCTSDCGGCGTHTRQCNGRIETEYCNMNPCNGNACCRPFDVIIGGVCSRFDEEYNSNGTKPIVTNTLPEDEPSTTPYITPESEKHIIHIQPPKLPLTIELPEEVFRPPERTLEVVLPEELDHEGSGQSAPETEITQPSHTNTVEGSGQEPAPRRAVPVPVVSESSSPVVEKPKNIQEIDKTMQSAVATEAEERQIVGGYKDTSKPSCEEKDGDKNDLKDDKCPLSQVHKADDVKDSGDKKSSKNHGKSSESDEDLAAEREDRIRARRYIFPSAIPRIRLPTASITASGRPLPR